MPRIHQRISQTRERFFLAFAGVVVLAIGILAYATDAAFRSGNEQADVTRQVVDSTNSLLSFLKDAETGQRGFLLTGEDVYLEPYRQAITQIPPALDKLSRLETERKRPDQQQRVERLKPVVKEKLDELAQTIEVRRHQGAEAALAIVRNDRGKEAMDQIRALCDEIQATSYQLTQLEVGKARRSASQTTLIAVVGSAGIFVFLVVATMSIESGTRRRHELIAALEEREDQLRSSRDWLRTTLSSIGDAVIATDGQGRITLLNAVAQTLTGWRQEEAQGKPLDQVFVIRNETSGLEVENPVTKVLREGQVVGLANHTELIAKNGDQTPIDDSAAPIRNARGEIDGVVLVFRDVSERRATERRLSEQSAELHRVTNLLKPVACFVRDMGDRIVYWNPGASDLYGFSEGEAMGRNCHALLNTQFPEPLEEILAQVRSTGGWNGDLQHTRRDGRQITVASYWALHHDSEGSPAAVLEVNLDITGRKEAEAALRAANEALSRANEDLNQFAFAASHDLQEPLRMISTYSQMLVRAYGRQHHEEAAKWVDFITEGTHRMHQLLADLLAYTQVGEGAPESASPVDLNQVLEIVVGNCKAASGDGEASVTSDHLPLVNGQQPHFIQLFQNLISNGLKYRSEQPPRIHVSAERQDGMVRIAVKDNGIGIAPKYHKQIFGVFKRLHGTSISGTGIGLAICQRVVDRYGGKIWVESQEARGSTFYFTLPMAPDEPTA